MMLKRHSIFYNFIMNTVLTVSSFIFPLITFPYVSRTLLPAGNGKVAFAGSIVAYFLLIAQLGIPIYGVRACAKARDSMEERSRTFREIFAISMIMCIVSYVLFFTALINIPRLRQEKELLAVTSANILCSTLGAEWFFKALEMYSYITWRSIAFKCAAIVLMFLLVHKPEDYVLYGAISVFAASASGIMNFMYIHKIVDFKQRLKLDIRRHVKPVFVFFVMICAISIYTNMDTTMLGFIRTDVDVGYYSAAVRVKSMLVAIITSLGAVLLPRVTVYLDKGDEASFNNVIKNSVRFVLFSAVPVSLYCTVAAEPDSFPFLASNDSRYNEKTLQELNPEDLLYFIPTSGWKKAFKERKTVIGLIP